MTSRENVLLLGGNGLIGSETAAQLIAEGGSDLTLLSRGTRYFDVGHARLTAQLPRWDFVVDFSALQASDVTSVLEALGGKVGHYIYISSDSVYEAWLQYLPHVGRPVPVTSTVNTCATSYVYVGDVARVVRTVMGRVRAGRPPRGAFNISLGPELSRCLKLIIIYTLPSVTRGPISIARARRELDFEPTPWPTVRKELVGFYLDAFHRFPKERQVILENLQHMAVDEEHRQRLKVAFRETLERGSAGETPAAQQKDAAPA
ncbi:hypothetical protein FJT64_008828 [Amphibalanus amphitrite]|uniref:Uncharacterized protein n=1 Tax=Amphibalanus amphitrite TaxID=1232801 RepID=A0A6A4VRG4_AMPAM|nr:hypothetical protein FJT64_008828 [Amphibalanus amphitrite]